MTDFYIKQNDTSPALLATITDADGPVNLTGASVTFYMASAVGSVKTIITSGAATVINAATGQVSYSWDAPDTAIAGIHIAEFEVVFSDASKETFPNDGYISINITPDIGEPA